MSPGDLGVLLAPSLAFLITRGRRALDGLRAAVFGGADLRPIFARPETP